MALKGYRGSWTNQGGFPPGGGAFDPAFGMQIFVDETGFPWSPRSDEAFIAELDAYRFDPTDVTVVGFPKSGTNWMQIMLANLYDDWGTCAIAQNRAVPQLDIGNSEKFEGYECVMASAHPRLTKAHVPLRKFPRHFREDGVSKVIYIYRNPKDSCISYYHELRAFGPMQFSPTLEEWVPQYIAGRCPFGSWLDNVLGWTGRKDGVLHLRYDEVKSDPEAALRQAVAFLGKPISEERLAKVVHDTHFDNMKDNDIKKQLNIGVHDESVSPFMRTGKTGGWRSVLTAEQSRMFDEAWGPALAEAGIHFPDM